MEDFFFSIATKIAEYAIVPILDHAQYLCCFHNFALNLSNNKEQLELTRDSVKKKIREATNRIEKVEPTVEKWLKDIEKVLDEVRMLEERILKVNKSYLRRQCQYSLAKEIERKTTKMIQLNRDSKFEPFSTTIELPGMEYYSSNDFFMFKSTEASYNKLLEILKNKSVSRIGLVGLGGSGKTTLAKEVGKKAQEMKLFHKVVITTVSQSLNIKRIRDEIIDQLSLELKEESDIGRAQRLSQRLRENTTLLILDDVWEKLNFEDLGIPFDESYKACCILITTRSKEVCTSMQCQSIIELNLLSDKEAWTLFTHYAKITDVSSEALKGVARKIINECKGLPIAIVTVGSTLKGKTVEDFELALSRLENSKPLNIPKGLISPYACLELSYNNLNNQLAQSLLLLCSMFPEDYEIDLEDLFRFGRGFGTVRTFGTMENARREMHEAIDILKSCFLLMQAGRKENVKLHDLVRDVALWIASKSGQAIFTGTEMDPSVLADDEIMKDKQAIALWNNGTEYGFVDYRINCPTLEILLLYSKGGIKVSDMGPQSWEKIKTLAIKSLNEYRKDLSLPESLKSLKNLRTLCLRNHDLGDISFVERLQALEILDLRDSSFENIPVGIVELKKLKILDLYRCWIKKKNVEAYKVVGRCLQLEELYFYLINLVQYFPHDVSFSRLQRYAIINTSYIDVFNNTTTMEKYAQSRRLLINEFDVTAQNFISLPIKDLFIRAEFLCLGHLQGNFKNIIPSMDQEGMNHLIALRLNFCKKIECLVDSTMNTCNSVFSKLVYLRLDSLCSLREVFCDPSSRCFLENLGELFINDCSKLNNISLLRKSKLCNLKVLSISECPLLTSLFEPSIVQSLVLLEKLIISSCSGLRYIIEEVEEKNNVLSSTQTHSSLTLQKLRILSIYKCDNLKYIFSVFLGVRLVSLERLDICSNSGLKYVFGSEKEHNIAVYPSFQQTDTKNLSNLGTLRLMNLPNVIDIWPEYCRPHLPNLKDLDCSACPKLLDSSIFEMVTSSNLQQNKTSMENETARLITNTFDQLNSLLFPLQLEELKLSDRRVKGLFQFQMEEEEGRGELVPLTLDITRLYLRNLPELNFIWKGPTGFLSLQKLQSVIVDGCPKLKTIFSITVVTTLPVLEGLDIHDCDELEQIFDLGDAQQLKTLYSSQQLCYPTLSSIEVKKCNKLNNLPGLNFIWKGPTGFLSLQKLRHVNVNGCPKLKTIFSITVVTSLPKLEFLYIYNCDELEQIFDLGDAQQLQTLYSSQQLCFPTLSSIDVTKCNKLKCLFYNLSASPFTSLKYLKIEECSQLHKAFGFEHEADDGGEEETAKKEEQVLQKLTGIALKNLPNFEEIHYGFKLKEDVYHIMEECPKYSPSLYLHPDM